MLKSYLKIALRHLLRHKTYVLINVAGLGVALAMCIVAYLNWKFDADFDKFHTKAEQLYRVNTIKKSTKQIYGISPSPLRALAKNEIAGVKDAILVDSWGLSVNVEDQSFYERFVFTESNFLDWFDFPILKGEAKLDDPSSVLITERSAKKYFGDQDPIGKTIKIFTEPERQKDLTVTGIVSNTPKNSSIYFDFIANKDNQVYSTGERLKDEDWNQWRDAVFLVLENPHEAKQIETQLNQYVAPLRAAKSDFDAQGFFLHSLEGLAHFAHDVRWDNLQQSTPPSAVWGNIVMAILLLLTACLNFANMTVSLAGKRLKEIGIRKVMGSSQRQLISQLLVESFLICLIALAFGILVAEWGVGWYNQNWKFIDLQLSFADNLPLVWFLLGTIVLTTLLAGAYPAFYLSSFNPNRIFQGAVKFGGSNLVSRILLGVQIAISLISIMASLTFARNAHFQQTADLGFQREGIQAVYTGNEQTFSVINNEVKNNPKVTGTAGVRFHIGDSCPRYEFELKGEKHEAEYMEVGEGYLELMDIKIVKGRAFNQEQALDFATAIMVNEKFVRDFFPDTDPIGQTLRFFDSLDCKIIAVVGDFMQDSFFDPLRPLVVKYAKPERYLYLAVRTRPEDMLETKNTLAGVWKTNFPTTPFDHNFQDEFLAESLEVTNNIKTSMIGLAVVTMLLTISGLFALMSLNILKKLKEIAVRRVLGASIGNIAYILNKNYFWIILGGIIIGCGTGAWLSLTLLDAIYRVHAGTSTFMMAVAGSIALLAVVVTIGLKLVQVMQANPAEVLKKE